MCVCVFIPIQLILSFRIVIVIEQRKTVGNNEKKSTVKWIKRVKNRRKWSCHQQKVSVIQIKTRTGSAIQEKDSFLDWNLMISREMVALCTIRCDFYLCVWGGKSNQKSNYTIWEPSSSTIQTTENYFSSQSNSKNTHFVTASLLNKSVNSAMLKLAFDQTRLKKKWKENIRNGIALKLMSISHIL